MLRQIFSSRAFAHAVGKYFSSPAAFLHDAPPDDVSLHLLGRHSITRPGISDHCVQNLRLMTLQCLGVEQTRIEVWGKSVARCLKRIWVPYDTPADTQDHAGGADSQSKFWFHASICFGYFHKRMWRPNLQVAWGKTR